MQVRFWGVRGSIPVPGPHTVRYGGNSSCVSVRLPGHAPLVFDAGTGARALGLALLQERVPAVHMLLTHFHTDHLFGLPFFGPIYAPSCQVEIGLQGYDADHASQRLAAYMNGTFHPVRVREVPSQLRFRGVQAGRAFEMGPYRVQPVALNHPGGAMGYRVDAGGRSVCYLTDTAPLARVGEGVADGQSPPPPERRLLELIEGADLVILDTMFAYEEFLEKMTWGHAYPEYGVALARAAQVGRLALFHHAPDATDEQLDGLAARWADAEGPRVFVAREGETVTLGGA